MVSVGSYSAETTLLLSDLAGDEDLEAPFLQILQRPKHLLSFPRIEYHIYTRLVSLK